MIDFHSHILPGIDDGSKSVEESLELLHMLSQQGINKVVATPHFYANHHSIDEFLQRRNASFANLSANMSKCLPDILLGAEVKYYNGISHLEGLERLRIGNTKLLLVEMPFCHWTESVVKEISELSYTGRFKIILAHIERYIAFKNMNSLYRLLDDDIIMQVNASFFNEFRTRYKALRMLKNGEIHILGSDCHNVKSRPPRLGNAVSIIDTRFDTDFVNNMNSFAESLLK